MATCTCHSDSPIYCAIHGLCKEATKSQPTCTCLSSPNGDDCALHDGKIPWPNLKKCDIDEILVAWEKQGKKKCYDQTHNDLLGEIARLKRHQQMLDSSLRDERDGKRSIQAANRELIRRIRKAATELDRRAEYSDLQKIVDELDPHHLIRSGILG
jgi:hypothetical protein